MSFSRGVAVLLVPLAVAACGAEAVEPLPTAHDLAGPWQLVPFRVAQSTISAAELACRKLQPPPNVRLAVVDARGASRLVLVYVGMRNEFDCHVMIDGLGNVTTDLGSGMESTERLPVPGPGSVTNLASSSGSSAAGNVSWLVGQAGPGVGAVEVDLRDGTRIRAALGPTGWFSAWWLGDQAYTAVTALDGAGQPTWTGR